MRVRARVTRFCAAGGSSSWISITSSALRFFFPVSSLAARSNRSSKRVGSVGCSVSSSTTNAARVRPTFATGFFRDDRVFPATVGSAAFAVEGPALGIFRGSFVAVFTSPFVVSFKAFFALVVFASFAFGRLRVVAIVAVVRPVTHTTTHVKLRVPIN